MFCDNPECVAHTESDNYFDLSVMIAGKERRLKRVQYRLFSRKTRKVTELNLCSICANVSKLTEIIK